MDKNVLWSLRLGFSAAQAPQIKKLGIEKFIRQSCNAAPRIQEPAFLANEPRTKDGIIGQRQRLTGNREAILEFNRQRTAAMFELNAWWVGRMRYETLPLREKMVLFLHNHYVSAVNIAYWAYGHNKVLRDNAFGNFREMTKQVLHTNAMVHYLDNENNRKGRFNENLSRELLELFTIGIGNYTEADIKGGAKGLAGLTTGDDRAYYKKEWENSEAFTYFGKIGNFKAGEMVDIIFEQKKAPYFFVRKLLKWFIYDNPPEELVQYYGDYFRRKGFEIEPLLIKMFSEEYDKPTSGSKIKDPLSFILQLTYELDAKQQSNKLLVLFARAQGMDLYKQPNVKGWDGGRAWLSSQIFQQRLNACDNLCKGTNLTKAIVKNTDIVDDYVADVKVDVKWSAKGNNETVIKELGDRLLFRMDDEMQKNLETVLRHDFDPNGKDAGVAVLRLFNGIVTTPEFQIL